MTSTRVVKQQFFSELASPGRSHHTKLMRQVKMLELQQKRLLAKRLKETT